ncbi:MAG: hypothetical protein ACK4KT_08650 [Thermaurantimonas sp.]
MKESIKDELRNFPLLLQLRDQIVQSKTKPGTFQNFQSIYWDFGIHRRNRKIRTLILAAAVTSAAAVAIFALFQRIAYQKAIEQQYYSRQSEWIAISDEAVLTIEYVKMYKNQPETNEIEWIWHTLD